MPDGFSGSGRSIAARLGHRTMAAIYDTIGKAYTQHRRADPRVAAQILDALGESASICNVGAGSGNYEPADRTVVAVEPSPVMIAARAPGAARVVRAVAAALPFASGSFEASLASLTLHHWPDWSEGISEMKRVSRRQVIFTFEPAVHLDFWLIREYFPWIARLESSRPPPAEALAEALGGAEIRTVPVPADCVDGFMWAYWNRPERYLDPEVQACTSGMSLISPSDRSAGTAALAGDLRSGRWLERHGDLLASDEIDGGFRLVIATQR